MSFRANRILIAAAASACLVALAACERNSTATDAPAATGPVAAKKAAAAAASADTTVTIAVEGMSCSGCENSIREAVEKLDGVAAVRATAKGKYAEVRCDPAKVTVPQIAAAINKLGYKADEKQTTVTK